MVGKFSSRSSILLVIPTRREEELPTKVLLESRPRHQNLLTILQHERHPRQLASGVVPLMHYGPLDGNLTPPDAVGFARVKQHVQLALQQDPVVECLRPVHGSRGIGGEIH